MTPDQCLAQVTRGQLGLFTTRQAVTAGFTPRQLDRRVAAGRLDHLGQGVYGLAGHEPSWERTVQAAVLAVGDKAVVSHLAAARLLGFDGFRAGPVELTVPRGRRARTPLARVHTTQVLPSTDVVTVGRFNLTSGARTIIDIATRVNERQLTAAIGSAVRDGWTSEEVLARRVAQLGGRRGVAILRAALAGPIGHSYLERRFLTLVHDAGLATPRTQVAFRGERVMRVDAFWEREGVVVEVMGHRYHCTAIDLQRDAQRRVELQELGFEMLEFTAADVLERPTYVISRLTRALRRRRDTPPPRRWKTVTWA
ncbi:MAG TPA: type IV toxin-antitoxin system AbiEi family antitoxin domain-containing protein [Acidimicrobiales bacterium]|nr:type IV toxin-antitoxin system AbiEi family antitoxin domain-containing protein [Acidimicrobiales bacterium]